MDLEFYPFYADDDRLYFDFLSVSPERTIRKAVIFKGTFKNQKVLRNLWYD